MHVFRLFIAVFFIVIIGGCTPQSKTITVEMMGISMEPQIYAGDNVLFSDEFSSLNQGDIIAFVKEDLSPKGIVIPNIKRVIALSGDTVDIDDINVYVNGVLLDEPYARWATEKTANPDATFPLTVPDGSVFVLGDNRNSSLDSRYSSLGFVFIDEIIGVIVE